MNMNWKRQLRRSGLVGITACVAGAGFGVMPAIDPVTAWGSGSAAGAVVADGGRWAVVSELSETITIDGTPGEAVWADSAQLVSFKQAYSETEEGGNAAYRLGYDSQYLYVFGEMDEALGDTLSRLEVVIQPSAFSEAYYVIPLPVDPSGPSMASWLKLDPVNVEPGRVDVAAAGVATTQTGGKLYIEASIPLQDIAPAGVQTADGWQMNLLHIHQLYAKPLASWIPLRSASHWHTGGSSARLDIPLINEGRTGTVYFGQAPDPFGGTAAVSRWTPEAELTYVSYEEKRLEVEFDSPLSAVPALSLKWKSPLGEWETVADWDADVDGPTLQLDFEHPAPQQAGIYGLQVSVQNGSGGVQTAIWTFDQERLVEAGERLQPNAPLPPPTITVDAQPPSATVADLIDLIPPQPGYRYVGLPEMPELYPDALYELSADKRSLISKRTQTVYPNAAYPETEALVVQNGKGETVQIPYYESASGQRYFISGHLWYLQKKWVVSQLPALAQSDPLGAARLLYALSVAYEGYNPSVDRDPYNGSHNAAAGPPYPYWGGIWDRWFYNELAAMKAMRTAYSAIMQTNAFDVLSTELSSDVHAKIVGGLFEPAVDYVLSYPMYYGNMTPVVLTALAETGKTLGRPDYIHRAIAFAKELADTVFLSDGFWKEVSLSYHHQTASQLQALANALSGWTDPVGYTSPRTGQRLDDLDLASEIPVLGTAIRMRNRLSYPDNKLLPISDTWANETASALPGERDTLLLPAAGIARLSGGTGAGQTQLYMGFEPGYGHAHYDPLNMTLYASGQELLPDLGYTHSSIYRSFTLSTLGHNTVVVNGKNAKVSGEAAHGGNIEAFAVGAGPVQAMRASQLEAYDETEEYNREPWFVPFADGSGAEGYVLDLFRVSGGTRHEYVLQGDANRETLWETPAERVAYGDYLLPPGTPVTMPTGPGNSGSAGGHYPAYMFVQDVEQLLPESDRYEVTLHTYDAGDKRSSLKITSLLESGSTTDSVYLGRSPSIQPIRVQGRTMDNNDVLEGHTSAKLVHRREGSGLDSTFVSLLEPYAKDARPRIDYAERVEPDFAPAGAEVVRVYYGDTTDILFSNPYHPDQTIQAGDVQMTGEMGLVRLKDGQVERMWLAGGSSLQAGGHSLTGGLAAGNVDATLRVRDGDAVNALVTATAVPAAAVGQYAIVKHANGSTTGLRITGVSASGGQTLLLLGDEDPGFRMAGGITAQTAFPLRSWSGGSTFTIALQSEYAPGSSTPPAPVGSVTGVVQDGQGLPLAGAHIALLGYGTVSAVSQADGSFSVAGAPVGMHRLRITKSGYAAQVTAPLEVTTGTATSAGTIVLAYTAPSVDLAPQTGQRIGLPLTATSTADAELYLVPASTMARPVDIIAAVQTVGGVVYGRTVSAVAGVPTGVPTENMFPGRYALYALDSEGRLSDPSAIWLIRNQSGMLDDMEPEFTYNGTWTVATGTANAWKETSHLASSPAAEVLLPFYGTRAEVISTLSKSRGMMHVYLNDVWQATVDQYASGNRYQQITYDTGELEEGFHVLRIAPAGERNPLSNNNVISFDALRVTAPLPEVSLSPGGLVLIGTDVALHASHTGQAYLVPSSTPAELAEITAAGTGSGGRTAPVVADSTVTLSTYGLPIGVYQAYLYSAEGVLSIPSEPVALLDAAQQPEWMQEDSALVYRQGSWTSYASSLHYGGSQYIASAQGATLDIYFYGSGAKLYASLSKSRGIVAMEVDGMSVGVVDQYNNGNAFKVTFFDTGTLAPGMHHIRMTVTGERNPNAVNQQVSLDAIQVRP